MTRESRPGPPRDRQVRRAPRLDLVGEDRPGHIVVRRTLRHGDDPEALFAAAGWRLGPGVDIDSDGTGSQVLTARFRVSHRDSGAPLGAAHRPGREPGLVVDDGEEPTVFQRVAAYAVVTSDRGVLLTEYSDRTAAPGSWGLPGGGIEPGEAPADALLREVWEESGQRVEIGRFLGIRTRHWIGRAPNGRLEDYHAVRVLFEARCPHPTEPVVHDVGGTTASAAWTAPERLAALEITSGWRPVLEDVLHEQDLTARGG